MADIMDNRWSYFVLPFLAVFIFSLLMINWSEISWVFDWQIVRRVAEDVVSKEPEPVPEAETELGQEAVGQIDQIRIPSLGVEAPLRSPASSDLNILAEELDRGVVLYPESVPPGEPGRSVILGHSAPPGYPDIKFDRVFSDLGDLAAGDVIEVYYQERLFSYVAEKVETMSVEEYGRLLLEPVPDDYTLIISTCYPPGRNWQRWVATAHLLTE